MKVEVKKLVRNPKYRDGHTPTEPQKLEEAFEGEIVAFGLGTTTYDQPHSGAYILLNDGSIVFEELFNIKKLEQ